MIPKILYASCSTIVPTTDTRKARPMIDNPKQHAITLETSVDVRSEMSGLIFLTISSSAIAAMEFMPDDAVLRAPLNMEEVKSPVSPGYFPIL